MFDPPSEKNWQMTGWFMEEYTEAYRLGYVAAQNGKDLEKDNPYKESGHERDTTFEDELNYWWYCGFSDFSR